MKKIIFSLAMIMAFSTLQSFETPAQGVQPATITYLGARENGVVFELRLDVAKGKRSELVIRNRKEEIIYEEYIKESKLVKHFVLPSDENDEYVFIVRNGNSRYEKKFTVSRVQTTSITVQEVI